MPHLIVLYSANLESETDMSALCRRLADAMLTMQDEQRQQVFPTGGVRVFAYPASHYAVADGQRDYAFVYLNLRMGRGRTAAIKQRAGETLLAAAKAHFEPLFATRYIGLTLQVDEGQEVFDAKHSTIHPLFRKP
ncbi:MAG: 5-carboxymethyl-2-hydroxymuconate Delta-isomerase [Gammaproteobacteria bacterium]|nr:MAG: 5-carboxymethyl-2-hydroxymuconate Delta-isomerase [Gammaproteobacteria bacterium]TLZ58841.1 MAG: 5-carboxymethyl-2-hydroxymuconate Delta-isomerase [Gammaproteobacteria bacterium]